MLYTLGSVLGSVCCIETGQESQDNGLNLDVPDFGPDIKTFKPRSVQHNLNMISPFYRLFKRFVNSWATDDEKMNSNEKHRPFINYRQILKTQRW